MEARSKRGWETRAARDTAPVAHVPRVPRLDAVHRYGMYRVRISWNIACATWSVAVSDSVAERPETRANLFGKELRLFPGSEMTALFHLVVVDEIGIGPLRPVPRGLVEFVREDAHGGRDNHPFDGEERPLVLPIETGP